MYVEGLVHITELGGEYFRFDEARQELRGERTGIRYALGTKVNVQVSRVDLDGRRIDFRLVTGEDELLLRAMRDKTGSGPDGDAPSGGAERSGKSRRKRDGGGSRATRPSNGAAAQMLEVKPGVKRAAGKKEPRGGDRAKSSKSRKNRR
jgi:ribonuclease R